MAKNTRSRPSRAAGTKKSKSSAKRKGTRAVASPEKTVPPQPAGPRPEALDVYQRGLAALQRHGYAEATEAFTALMGQFPNEQGLLDRARVYLEVCRRSLDGQAPDPQTAEERLTAATAALNNGDESRAESLSMSVLADNPADDLALYLLATIDIRRGMTDAAMTHLAEAIAVDPEAASQARQDADFKPLHGDEAFQELTRPPAPTGGRRARRGAPEP
jgi:tetratricopeptide (TPR) repeat protein